MTTPSAGLGGQILVIGYGNSLRGDDGIGWHVTTLLASNPRWANIGVLARHQLAPELAEDLASARLAVLVDACRRGLPGTVSVRRIQPCHPRFATWSHYLAPAALAGLANTLYGSCAPVFLVTLTGAFFDYGQCLSPPARRALPKIIDTLEYLHAKHAKD